MIFLHRRVNLICRALALTVLFLGLPAWSQSVILHLRNGDRIAGTILSENTNAVTLSTVWIKELVVPLAQIERRETPPASITAATTNVVVAGTNAVPAAGATNATSVVVKPAKPAVVTLTTNAPPIPWFKRWKGEAGVGMDMERGATDHELYYARFKATYSQPYASDPKQFFRNILSYDAAYGKTTQSVLVGSQTETTDVVSANRMDGSSKTDFDVDRKIYFYNLGGGGYDEIRKIDLHYEDGPGMGYHLLKRTNFATNAELGANYQVEDRSDNTSTRNFYYRFGEDLTWKINRPMTMTEKFEFFPRRGLYRTVSFPV